MIGMSWLSVLSLHHPTWILGMFSFCSRVQAWMSFKSDWLCLKCWDIPWLFQTDCSKTYHFATWSSMRVLSGWISWQLVAIRTSTPRILSLSESAPQLNWFVWPAVSEGRMQRKASCHPLKCWFEGKCYRKDAFISWPDPPKNRCKWRLGSTNYTCFTSFSNSRRLRSPSHIFRRLLFCRS